MCVSDRARPSGRPNSGCGTGTRPLAGGITCRRDLDRQPPRAFAFVLLRFNQVSLLDTATALALRLRAAQQAVAKLAVQRLASVSQPTDYLLAARKPISRHGGTLVGNCVCGTVGR